MKVLYLKESAQKRCKCAILFFCYLYWIFVLNSKTNKNGDKIRGQKRRGKQSFDHHTWHDKKMKHYHLFSQGQNQLVYFGPLKT